MKYLKHFLPKDTLLDTTISLVFTFFIVMSLLFWLNFCFSISITPNFITVISHFYIYFHNVFFFNF